MAQLTDSDSIFTTSVTFDPARDVMPLSEVYPDATQYGAALDAIAPGVTTQIDRTQLAGESWTDTLQRILPALATTYQQHQLLQIQVDRAKAGLPPLDATQYAAGVQLGIAPGTQKLLMWGGAALAGLLALNLLKGR